MASPFGLLGGAAGAGEALKQLLAERFKQQMEQRTLAQRQSEAQAEDVYRNKALGEQTELRKATQAQTASQNEIANQLRRDQLAQGLQIAQLGQTAQTERNQASIAATNERARQAGLDREALARLTASLRPPASEPLVPVQQDNGMVTYMPRSQAAGQQRPVPSGERAQGISADRTLDYATQIATKFNKDFVGPGASRYLDLKQAIPGIAGNPAYGDFKSSVAALRNEMTRLLFSSRASDQDIQRVQEQIPNMFDKPDVFLQKLRQTKTNAERLRQQLSAQGVP